MRMMDMFINLIHKSLDVKIIRCRDHFFKIIPNSLLIIINKLDNSSLPYPILSMTSTRRSVGWCWEDVDDNPPSSCESVVLIFLGGSLFIPIFGCWSILILMFCDIDHLNYFSWCDRDHINYFILMFCDRYHIIILLVFGCWSVFVNLGYNLCSYCDGREGESSI